MTPDQIDKIYDRLQALVVPIQHDPLLGVQYLMERVILARAYHDEATNLLMDVTKVLQAEKHQLRVTLSLVKLSDGEQRKALERQVIDQRNIVERLAAVTSMVNVRRAGLVQTVSSARILLDCIRQGLPGAEFKTPIAPGQTLASTTLPNPDDAVTGDIDRFCATKDEPPPQHATESELDDLMRGP